MSDHERIEAAVEAAVVRLTEQGCPPRLAEAMRHAVLGRGHRLRPRLLLAVCRAVRGEATDLAVTTATALELLHCASLVHDDLPCFDDAPVRRGAPSVHRAHGEAVAVLAGDALIIGAFELIGEAAAMGTGVGRLVALLGRAAGAPGGTAAGQGWEGESDARARSATASKDTSLFEFAAMAGALAGGADPEPWRELGRRIGLAYSHARDLGREPRGPAAGPGAVPTRGSGPGPDADLAALIRSAIDAVPACEGEDALRGFVAQVLESLSGV